MIFNIKQFKRRFLNSVKRRFDGLVAPKIPEMKTCLILALLAHSIACEAFYTTSSQPTYQPETYTLAASGPVPLNNATVYKLSSDGSSPAIVILDYGKNVEGYATFEVTQQSGNTSIFEMSYGETREALDVYMVRVWIGFANPER